MWCQLLDNVLDLKHKFERDFGKEALWNEKHEFGNFVHYWAAKYNQYEDMFRPLLIEQFGDYALFRYDIMETNKDFWNRYDGMYRECRSIVLDLKNESIVLSPFAKFFNLNETDETQECIVRERIAKSTNITVTDKLDGSMQSARYYNGKIVLSGTRNMDPNFSKRVAVGYKLLTKNYQKMLIENTNNTFIFELIHPCDKHIVDYDDSMIGLHLIGVRNTTTGYQYSYREVVEYAQKYDVKCVTISQLNFEELLLQLDDKKCNEAEGFVVDIDGYKIKIKYNDYVALHKVLLKTLSTNTIIQAINNNTWDDLFSKIPNSYKEESTIVAENVKRYVSKRSDSIVKIYKKCLENYTKSTDKKEDKKNFVNYVNNNHKKDLSFLANLYNGNTNNYLISRSGRQIKYKDILKWLSENP